MLILAPYIWYDRHEALFDYYNKYLFDLVALESNYELGKERKRIIKILNIVCNRIEK